MALPLIVLDASAALALVLAEEEGLEVERILTDIIARNGQIFVPSLFWFEVGNGMLVAEQRGRISAKESSQANHHLSQLPIVTHAPLDDETRGRITGISRTHGLSYYDAGYLELSIRFQARPKTFDRHLLQIKEAVPLIL